MTYDLGLLESALTTLLVAYRADIGPLLDGRSGTALAPFGMSPVALADPGWRDQMLARRTVPTQQLAEVAIAHGFAELLVPSYARGAPSDALNLVLWAWEGQLTLIDDADRLGLRPAIGRDRPPLERRLRRVAC